MNSYVIDIETTGLDPLRHGIVEIAAKSSITGAEFCIQPRIRDEAEIDPIAMEVNGISESAARDEGRVDEEIAIAELFRFIGLGERAVLAGMNPNFDLRFITEAAKRAGLKNPFSHRILDLHSLAVVYAFHRDLDVPQTGFRTDQIYEMLGMPPEPRPHQALTGVRMEFDAFHLMLAPQPDPQTP